ncbi:DEAD-box ATP-dependent RNA helicase 7 [Platanthera guangdongensis]|uniref:DEAD-box ATP-dependent RNA helicase 7 n=1 Tax=Platanthera guangdongensis TaxID=2320717 RepID=A0ABR2LNE2_9ASPA
MKGSRHKNKTNISLQRRAIIFEPRGHWIVVFLAFEWIPIETWISLCVWSSNPVYSPRNMISSHFLVLVATNLAARGLDIRDVQLIIQVEVRVVMDNFVVWQDYGGPIMEEPI